MDPVRRKQPATPAEAAAWLAAQQERMVAKLASAGDEKVRPRRGRRLPWIAAALAAASVVLWALLLHEASPPAVDPDARIVLGADELGLLRPLGDVPAFAPFEWEGHPPAGGSARIELGSRANPDVALVSQVVSGNRWSPPPDVIETLPRDLWWRLQFVNKLGVAVASKRGDATLRRD